MGFFENLGNKLSNTGKDIAKKTKDMSDTSKLNSEIRKNQDLINKTYSDIGKLYFENYSNLDCPELKELCDKITEANAKIEELRVEVLRIKGFVICPKCGKEVSTSAMFCGNCGNKMKEESEVVEEATVEEAPAEETVETAEPAEEVKEPAKKTSTKKSKENNK